MKNRFPRRQELTILVALSICSAVIVAACGDYHVGLSVLGVPVFLVAVLMGFRRASAPTPVGEAGAEPSRQDVTAEQ